ncbi:GNAT family N-acetyltransferase [Dankookia sp. GCM10030260]|uniref:GNAT family N-acetyltransferase n=1 Tax=Dankookia sp. GCM10030260 TaxID=3273390 RepID=UPI00360CA5C4
MIRPATVADAAALAAMLRAINDEPGLRPDLISTASVARDLIGDPRALVLLAVQAGEAVGFATAHPHYDSGHSRWGMFLNDLYVAPGARRRGIGRALVGAVAAAARRDGGRFVWWNADAGDDLALGFHATLGAEEAMVTDFLLAGETFDRLAGESLP